MLTSLTLTEFGKALISWMRSTETSASVQHCHRCSLWYSQQCYRTFRISKFSLNSLHCRCHLRYSFSKGDRRQSVLLPNGITFCGSTRSPQICCSEGSSWYKSLVACQVSPRNMGIPWYVSRQPSTQYCLPWLGSVQHRPPSSDGINPNTLEHLRQTIAAVDIVA